MSEEVQEIIEIDVYDDAERMIEYYECPDCNATISDIEFLRTRYSEGGCLRCGAPYSIFVSKKIKANIVIDRIREEIER